MALTDLYDALARSIQDDALDLYAAGGQPGLAGLRGVVALFGATAAGQAVDTVRSPRLAQTASSVIVLGTVDFSVPGGEPTAMAATLTVTLPTATPSFVLAYAAPAQDWTFSTTFPNLPEHQQYDPATKQILFTPSFLVGLPLRSAVFTARSGEDARLTLSGDLPPEGALAAYESYFDRWPLRLDGPVTLPTDVDLFPAFELSAASPGKSQPFGDAQLLDIGLRLAVYNDLDPQANGVTALSALDLIGHLYVARDRPPILLSTPLLASPDLWRLQAEIPDDLLRIGDGIARVTGLLGLRPDQLVMPPGLDTFNDFFVSELELWLRPPPWQRLGPLGPGVETIAVSLSSNKLWTPPIPFVQVRDVGTRWVVGLLPSGGVSLSGSVYGGITIGPTQPTAGGPVLQDSPPEPPGPGSFTIDVAALIPQFVITGRLRTDDRIPLGNALAHFFGDPGPATTSSGLDVTAMSIQAEPLSKTVDVVAELTTDWQVPLVGNVALNLESLFLHVNATQGAVYGTITGTTALLGGSAPGEEPPRFELGAEYVPSTTGAGWTFTGRLLEGTPLRLDQLVINLLGIDPPPDWDWLSTGPTPSIDRMALRFTTGTREYAASGTLSTRWTPSFFGSQWSLSAEATAEVERLAGQASPSGRLTGVFAVNKVAVTLACDIGVDRPTWLFRIQFGDLWLSAVTGWVSRPGQDQPTPVLTAQLGGVTLGGILEYLVNLAAPSLGFALDPPWDALNRIDLSRFVLTVEPVNNVISFTYQADVDLGVMRIDKIGVRYERVDGQGAVNLILEGDFLGRSYRGDNALKWDVISDPPPAVPGSGQTLFEVRYLGVGQHLLLPNDAALGTVRAVLDQLTRDMRPVGDPYKNPLKQPSGSALRFAPDTEWLIGLDLRLMETVQLGLVFKDPGLYGLSLALSGPRAGALAGLNFEILYRKITNDLGVFRVELQVPESSRRFELGEVSLTLGIITVEIYTNGNFLVDLGFPRQRSFDRSFVLQLFPFIGRGGLYFGLLDGSTSPRVPRISNGTFAPVLELGIGLAAGVGKEISVGALSGNIYVEIEGIFQGALAWFNPESSSVAPARYYQCQGLVSIHGRLNGKVDFKVVKAAVSVEAFAEASAVLEAYQSTLIRLAVGVSAEAEVEVGWWTVSFSFDVQLDVSFTIGRVETKPWILAGGDAPSQGQRRRAELPAEARAATPSARARVVAPFLLHWDPTAVVFGDAPRPVPVTMLPVFSATDVPLSWSGAPPANPAPSYRVAMLLFAENGVSPEARAAHETRVRSAARSAHADDVSELPAATLMEAFLRWALRAVTGPRGTDASATITATELALLAEQLGWPQTENQGFSFENLQGFLGANLVLQLSGAPGGAPLPRGGMVVPMPPVLTWTWTGEAPGSRDFAGYQPVGPLYEWGADQYLAAFFPRAIPSPPPPTDDDPAGYESFSSFAFRDWCLMITRSAVQAARDRMERWELSVTAPSSLRDLAGRFPTLQVGHVVRAGDTVESVAAAVGATPDELTFLNPGLGGALESAPPGATLQVTLGIAPELLAIDNPTLTLAPGRYALGALSYPLQATDTLNDLAGTFGYGDARGLLDANPALAGDRQLLQPGASFQVPSRTWAAPAGFDALLTAAVFYVRCFAPTDVPHAGWYASTLAQWNTATLQALNPGDPLPVGTVLAAPGALASADRTGAISYTTLPGDTLPRIGAALALAQNQGTGTWGQDTTWPAFRDGVVPGPGGFTLPEASVAVLPAETLNALTDRTLASDDLLGWIGGAPVLSPMALLELNDVQVDTNAHPTFGAIAAAYGLRVGDVGTRLTDAPGLIPGSAAAPTTVTVTQLPVQTIDALVAAVLAGPEVSQLSTQSSRQMLAGLRLPAPEADSGGHVGATGPMTAFYDLTGQQIPGPAPTDGDDPLLEMTVSTGAPWIQLMGSTTVGQGETLAGLSARAPEAVRHNRRLARLAVVPGGADTPLPAGLVAQTGPVSQLDYSFTGRELQRLYPTAALGVTPVSGPAPLSLAAEVPLTYGLDHRIELQAPVPLPIPSPGGTPLIGVASLWPFPSGFAARAEAATATPYELVLAPPRSDASAADLVQNVTWATLLPFQVRRLEGRDGVYGLIGADTAGRQVLLQLWQYLAGDPPAGTRAFLLVAPAPDAGNPDGLAALQLDPAATFLIKSNLSTETVPGLGPLDGSRLRSVPAGEGPVYAADFAHLGDFLKLLWEGSVVGGNGYTLGLATLDGAGLPASSFDLEDVAGLRLLVIAGEQQAEAPQGRALLRFNNCALVGPGLDASARSLYAQAADDSEWVRQATVPPGHVGFTLTLDRPLDPVVERADVHQLFSLLTFGVGPQPGAVFHQDRPGLPAVPQAEDGQGQPRWRRQRAARRRRARGLAADGAPAARPFWRYDQVVPIARMGPPSLAPAVAGLPPPGEDPYRGIGGQPTAPSAVFQLGLADVLGNVTAPPEDDTGQVEAQVGYTDALIPVGQWPATTRQFSLAAANGEVTVTLGLAAQPGALMPGLAQWPDAVAELAVRQAEQYARIYYQLAQPDLTVSALTTLKQDATGAPEPVVLEGAPGALWAFAAGSYLYAAAVPRLTPVHPFAAAGGSFAGAAAGYGMPAALFGAVAANRPAIEVLGTAPLPLPAHLIFAERDTASGLVASAPPGWPRPDAADLLTLAPNAALPLRPGIDLATPPTAIPVPSTSPTPSLADLAGANHTSVALLATDNADADVLKAGFGFKMDGLTVTVDDTAIRSFSDVVAAFEALGVHVTVADVAVAHAGTADLFAGGATLTSTHYRVSAPTPPRTARDTLADNESGYTAAQLAPLNVDTVDLFDAGARVYLGDFSPAPAVEATDTATLQQFAHRYGATAEQLFGALAEAGFTFRAGQGVAVPGMLAWPDALDGIRVPYTIAASDTLASVAAKFALPPDAADAVTRLATANGATPSTLLPGVDLRVPFQGTSYEAVTRAGDTFDLVLARLQALNPGIAMQDLAVAIQAVPDLLAPGALLVCPPARLPTAPNGQTAWTPLAAGALYGLDPAAFAQANAALSGLIVPGVTLTCDPGDPQAATVVTGTRDTFNTLVARFEEARGPLSVGGLVSANANVAFLAPGGMALLPPRPLALPVNIGSGAGPFARPVFPLEVGLRLQRPGALVADAFQTPDNDGPVERADVRFPPPMRAQGQGEDATPTLTDLALAFSAALPTLRLATGHVAGSDADLWVVDFGVDGIASVRVAPGVPAPGGAQWPRFFALRPLYPDPVTRRDVILPEVQPDGTCVDAPTGVDFQGVDVEVWARRALADIDRLLTPPFVAGMYADETARASLTAVLQAKQTLTGAVAEGLAPVLALEDPGAEAGRAAAVETLTGQLGVSLGRAYGAAAVVQYDAEVTSTLSPARLLADASLQPPPGAVGPRHASVTSSRVDLGQPTSFVSFLLTLEDPASHGNVTLELRCDGSHLELEPQPIPVDDATTYEASNWLTFVPPLTADARPAGVQMDLGTPEVPIPLRSYPATPSLVGHQALPDPGPGPANLATAPRWRYRLTWSHEHAAQDEVGVTAKFNLAPRPARRAVAGTQDLATALARYTHAAEALWQQLTFFAHPRGGDAAPAANAAESFAALVSDVAEAWDGHWESTPGLRSDGPTPESGQELGFLASLVYDGEGKLQALKLVARQDSPGPTGSWPDAVYRAPDGVPVPLGKGETQDDGARVYAFPARLPAAAWAEVTLEWAGLSVADFQNASASLAVERNTALLAGVETNPDFVFRTATIDAPGAVSPHNVYTGPFDITPLGGDIEAALSVVFTTLFGDAQDDLRITVGLEYGYELVPAVGASPGITSYLPVGLYPNQTLSGETAGIIAGALERWMASNTPATRGGEWALSLALYSQLDTSAQRPLLTLERLVYRIGNDEP